MMTDEAMTVDAPTKAEALMLLDEEIIAAANGDISLADMIAKSCAFRSEPDPTSGDVSKLIELFYHLYPKYHDEWSRIKRENDALPPEQRLPTWSL